MEGHMGLQVGKIKDIPSPYFGDKIKNRNLWRKSPGLGQYETCLKLTNQICNDFNTNHAIFFKPRQDPLNLVGLQLLREMLYIN